MDYTHLTVEHRRQVLTNRLLQVEEQHFNVLCTLFQVKAASDGAQEDITNLRNLTKQLHILEKGRAALEDMLRGLPEDEPDQPDESEPDRDGGLSDEFLSSEL